MIEEKRLKASLDWDGKKVIFEGSPEAVWASINKFLS